MKLMHDPLRRNRAVDENAADHHGPACMRPNEDGPMLPFVLRGVGPHKYGALEQPRLFLVGRVQKHFPFAGVGQIERLKLLFERWAGAGFLLSGRLIRSEDYARKDQTDKGGDRAHLVRSEEQL